jgi:hypothetical protein
MHHFCVHSRASECRVAFLNISWSIGGNRTHTTPSFLTPPFSIHSIVGAPRVLFTPLRFLLGKSVMAGMEINNKRETLSAFPLWKKTTFQTLFSLYATNSICLSFFLSLLKQTLWYCCLIPAENKMNQWWIFNFLFTFLCVSANIDAGRERPTSPAAQRAAESRATFFAEEDGAAVATIWTVEPWNVDF